MSLADSLSILFRIIGHQGFGRGRGPLGRGRANSRNAITVALSFGNYLSTRSGSEAGVANERQSTAEMFLKRQCERSHSQSEAKSGKDPAGKASTRSLTPAELAQVQGEGPVRAAYADLWTATSRCSSGWRSGSGRRAWTAATNAGYLPAGSKRTFAVPADERLFSSAQMGNRPTRSGCRRNSLNPESNREPDPAVPVP